MNDIVKDWQLYEAGKKYNNSIKCVNNSNYYDLMDALIDFVNGNQWRNLEITGMRKCVFNIFNKALRFWVASITASNTKIDLEPLEYSQDEPNEQMDIAEMASAEIMNLFEKFKMDNRIRDALQKAGTMGDVAGHFYFDPTKKPYGGAFDDVKGEICFELVNGTNVFFGNANNPNTDIQPYIIISGRDMVENLKNEAIRAKSSKENQDKIEDDKDYEYEAGADAEIEVDADGFGKATYIIVYRKTTVKDKKQRQAVDELGQPAINELGQPIMEEYEEDRTTILVSKCVKNAYIYKDVDTGLSVYPVNWLVWDRQESQYHGKPPLAEAMETQIWINLGFAMIMYHLAMTAFPKAVFNKKYITSWSNRIAEAIPVEGLADGMVNIRNLAGYLEPGQMSPQIVQVIQLAYDFLKDLLGINDAMLGNINPEQTSGKAILATVQQGTIPLENTRANEYEWIEDAGKILLDMMGTYYGTRPTVIEKDGVRTVVEFDYSVLKNIWLNVRVDVGTTNVWSDIARKQTLTNLMMEGKIELIDWLESMDDTDLPNRQKLIDKINAAMQGQQFAAFEQFIAQLSPQLQAAIQQESQMMMGGMQGGVQQMPGMQ
jgi:hypothetical protein